MASIIIRRLDPNVKQALAEQAREHGRSMEAEARNIITSAVARPHIGLALLQAAQTSLQGEDLVFENPKDEARITDFE